VPAPADNPTTPEKIHLGKNLFFDPRLSKDGTVSCNSCHNVMAGGEDNRPVSVGVGGKTGGRSAPTVWNAAFHMGIRKSPSFQSDSFEALLEAAAYGSVVAILPERVARRKGSFMTELTPPAVIQSGAGRHRISLISRQNCDERENAFLAREITGLLGEPRTR